MNRTWRSVVSVPMFFPAPTIVSQTDMIATLPATMVRDYAHLFGLVSKDPRWIWAR